jgi:hypothetical protein
MKTTTKPPKKTPTVESVKEAIGRTWFDVSDEDSRIDVESRQYGDVGNETPGKRDIDEGKRLFKLIRKVFKASKWVLTFNITDEWVTVSLRKEPITAKEKAEAVRKKRIETVRSRLEALVLVANEARKAEGYRTPFSSHVYDGHYNVSATVKVNFGKRYLYLEHMNSRFVFADEDTAGAAIADIMKGLEDLTWERTVREPTPRRTGNRPPPHNIIEEEGYIEFKADLRQHLSAK